jgi:hypothetical protein
LLIAAREYGGITPNFNADAAEARGKIETLRDAVDRLAYVTGGWTFKELQGLARAFKREILPRPSTDTSKEPAVFSAEALANCISKSVPTDLEGILRGADYTEPKAIDIPVVMDGVKILGNMRALKLREWYGPRESGAKEEAIRVLKICTVREDIDDGQVNEAHGSPNTQRNVIEEFAKQLCSGTQPKV